MGELNSGDRKLRSRHGLETVQGRAPSLDGSVVLLDDAVQVSLIVTPEQRVKAQQPERPVTRGVAVERCLPWSASVIRGHGIAEERLGDCSAAVGPQKEIDRPAFLVDRPIEVGPSASNLHARFINARRTARRAPEPVPARLVLRNVPPNPSPDRRRVDVDPPLAEHFCQVPGAQSEPDVLADSRRDDLVLVAAIPEHRLSTSVTGH
jgi:hypothetical protein